VPKLLQSVAQFARAGAYTRLILPSVSLVGPQKTEAIRDRAYLKNMRFGLFGRSALHKPYVLSVLCFKEWHRTCDYP